MKKWTLLTLVIVLSLFLVYPASGQVKKPLVIPPRPPLIFEDGAAVNSYPWKVIHNCTQTVNADGTITLTCGVPAINDIGDATGDGTINQTGYKQIFTSTLDTGAVWTMTNTDASHAGAFSFIDFALTENGGANGFFMRGYDNVSELKWSIGQDGNASFGTVTAALSGNASTASALFADPANCVAGQIALGITAAGVAECTATPSGLTSVGATTFTGALTGTASGNIANSVIVAAGDIVIGSGAGVATVKTKGANNTLFGVNGSGVLDFYSSIDYAAVNAAGGSKDVLTFSGTLGIMDGTPDTFRGIYLNYTNADHTGAGNLFYGVDVKGITGDTETTETALNVGTGWDYGVYSASPGYFSTLSSGTFNLPSTNADPATTAGQLRHDSTVTNHTRGALRWFDGTGIRQLVDVTAAIAEGCSDDYVIAYDADTDAFYCKVDAGAATTMANDALWAVAGDIAYATNNDTGAILPIGTAYQVLHTNSGATAPAWTSTLGATGTRLTKVWASDIETSALTVSDVADNNYIKVTTNTTRAAAGSPAMELYPEGTVWKANQAGTEYSFALSNSAAQLYFNTGGSTARTITVPDAAITLARIDAAQTFTGVNTFVTGDIILGANTTTAGSVKFFGGTSGSITLVPTAIAGTTTLTLPATSGTLAKAGTLTNTKWCSSDGVVVNCNEDAPAGAGDITAVGSCLTGSCASIGNADTSGGYLDFLEDSDNGTNYIRIKAKDAITSSATILIGETFTDTKWCSYGSATGLTCNENNPGATVIDAIGDAAADGTIALAGYEITLTSTLDEADHSVLTIYNTDADRGADTTLLTLKDNDAADANAFFVKMIADADGTPATIFSVTGLSVVITPNTSVSGTFGAGISTFTDQSITTSGSDTAATSPLIDLRRERDGNPTQDVADNDYLGEIRFRGYKTDGYYEGAIIRAVVNGTPGSGDMPTELIFATSADGSGTPTTRLTIDSAGLATFAGDMVVSGGDLTLGATSGTVKGTITFYGDTSGTAVLSAPDEAGAGTAIVLPATAGTLALSDQAMFIGTTSVAINRTTAALTLAGITLTTPVLGEATATQLLASGIVDGTAPILLTTTTTGATLTLGGTYKSGYTYNNYTTAATAVTYTLPGAAAGLQYCVGNWTGKTGILTVQTAGADIIDYNGAAGSAGGHIASGGALGDAACFVGIDADNWKAYVSKGTWALAGP